MNIPAAFKPGELWRVFGICVTVSALTIGLIPSVLFETALFLWIPFFFILLVLVGRFGQIKLATINTKASVLISILKIFSAFLLLVVCFFGFGKGLLLYQAVSYDSNGVPGTTEIFRLVQLLWAVKLALMSWVIASGLAIAMGAFNKQKVSEFFMPRIKHYPQYALFIDSVVAFSFCILLMLFISLGSVELARTVVVALGYQRPVFPEVTVIVLALTLISGYYALKLKKRNQDLANKSVSIGRMLFTQTAWISGLLLVGQGAIIFFPDALIVPLMKPVFNMFINLEYEKTWLFITLTAAILTSPILARYLVRTLSGRTIWHAFLMLIIPIGVGLLIIYPWGSAWIPVAYFDPIMLDNIMYRIEPAPFILLGSLICLLLCFAQSNTLQMALVDVMPAHLGQRLRRLRGLLAKQILPLILICAMYLFFANVTYYFISGLLLILVTLTLLWVSLHLFYNLTKIKRAR